MSSLNKAQLKSIIITPSITGCISIIASISLIVSIFRSHLKLSTVYRRLVFFLSAFDIIVSIAQLLSTLPMPAGSIWGAIGNSATCDLQGFISTVGFAGTLLYSLSLTIYFLLVVKFDMSEAKIKKNVEPFLHAVPILYSLTIATIIYATDNYNNSGTVCWIAPEPVNCEIDPEVECLSIGDAHILRWIGAGGIIFGVFFGNCTILAVIWWTFRSQLKKNQAYSNIFANSPSTPSPRVTQNDEEQAALMRSCCTCCPFTSNCCNSSSSNTPTSVLANYLSRPSRAAVRRSEEVANRAAAYVIGFICSFIFMMIYRIIAFSHGSSRVPFTILFLARFFFPLQGFFNVLVYTYPHVTSYKRNHTDSNWLQAFWQVIKSGGDDDKSRKRGERRESLRKQQRVLEQSQNRCNRNTLGNLIPASPNDEREI